ncbi:unnamed protein product [Heterobilharzia americana]|nr:unnamed protein product [Heterobilharzia americana]
MNNISSNLLTLQIFVNVRQPFKRKSKCTAEKLARSGFFRPDSKLPDVTQCFVCLKELEGWEPNDDPDKEHKNHSPKCPFLKSKPYEEMTCREGLEMDVERYCNYLSDLIPKEIDIEKAQKKFKKLLEIVLSKLPKRTRRRKSQSRAADSLLSNISTRSTRNTRRK